MFAVSSRALRCARIVLVFVCIVLTAAPALAVFNTFTANGANAAAIQGQVDAYRAALGNPNNGTAAATTGGRREINWDGGGSGVSSPTGSPTTNFQNRGVTFTTSGTGFLQTPLGDPVFTFIEPSYETTFSTFSAQRIFTPLGSNVMEATFSVPGSGGLMPATVAGFGAVFSDVDLPNTTRLELFDFAGAAIGSAFVPPGGATSGSGSLSFLGVLANDGERIARVRITTGNQPLSAIDSNGNPVDVVVMDDFLFSEPVAIPEPGVVALVALAFACVALIVRRRVPGLA